MTYLDAIADEIRDELPKEALPADGGADLFRMYAVLLMAKGQSVSSRDVHNAWVAWMAGRGDRHPSMRPFEELRESTKAEDLPYVLAIRRVAARQEDAL